MGCNYLSLPLIPYSGIKSACTHIHIVHKFVNVLYLLNAHKMRFTGCDIFHLDNCKVWVKLKTKLELLEGLRSEDTPRCLMITHTIESCWIPSQNKVEWPWRYGSRPKVITCDTPSRASDHLYQIWKESIQNCRRYRAYTIFKVKAEWPWKYRSRSKVITCDTPSDANDDLCQIWKECKQNCSFFQGESRKLRKICKKLKF